jgi:NADH-quinone oxidoreductase subunit N
MTLPILNLPALAPEIILVVAALVVLMADLVVAQKRALGWFSLGAVLLALVATLWYTPAQPGFQNMALADGLGRFMGAAVLAAAALAALLSIERIGDYTDRPGAFYALLLLASVGMRVMTVASDFMVIFLGLEILSLALYILVGIDARDARGAEAALKYFLLGAFASGFFLYGIALIYAATGTTNLDQLSQGLLPLSVPLPGAPLLPIGVALLLVGFGFKLALAPFHMWTPDAYQGAPTPVTAFMSVATKTAAFAALIRVLAALTTFERPWLLALAALAVLTMTLGNLAALRQTSLKRMLAYSSIAHAGYVLTGLAAGNAEGAQGALYYLLGYTFMNIGAFAVLLAIQRRDENDISTAQMTGLAARQPALALLMAIFMFALTGIPPLTGFFGKLYVFSAAVRGGLTWLAIIGALNSAISAYYYLRVTVSMYMTEPAAAPVTPALAGVPALAIPEASGAETPMTRWPVWTALVIAAVAVVGLGIWQLPWMTTITQAVATLALR